VSEPPRCLCELPRDATREDVEKFLATVQAERLAAFLAAASADKNPEEG
jgi:hypothetical protein